MSNVVDDRIVNMRFDNSNFEKNVATSINTLDRLKQSLDFSNSEKSLQGLQDATNNFSSGKIEEALYAIQNRFSTMGIIGMTVIQNLTGSVMNMISNISSKIYNLIASGGISRAMNIENAKFQMEGLGIKYTEVFDAIDYAVTNTAYGLDAAAQAASQLSAAGLDYKNVIMTHKTDNKELTEMSMALRAVSGVAAQTQSDYAMVARYFQDVANAGQVTGATLTYMTQVLNLPVKQDLAEGLKQIANGSYEASEEVQNAVKKMVKGTEVSVDQVEKMASKGLLSFDIFSTIMFNKYADHAVAANRTITGVMSNIRAAFSKIGAEFVSPIIEIDGIVVQMLDSIRAKVNEIKPLIIPFAKSVTGSVKQIASILKVDIDKANLDWIKPFFTGLGKIIEGIVNDLGVMRSAFKSVFPSDTANKLKTFAENFEKFGKEFNLREKSVARVQQLTERFKGFFSLLSAGKTILQTFLSPFKGFIEGLKESEGFSGSLIDNFADWAKNLDKMLKDSTKLKEISDKLFESGKVIGGSFTTIVKDVINVFRSIKEGPEAVLDSLFDGLVRDVGNNVLQLVQILTGKDMTSAKKAFNDFIDNVITFVGKLKDTFNNGFDSVKDFFGKIKGLFSKGEGSSDKGKGFFLTRTVNDEKSGLQTALDSFEGVLTKFLEFLSSTLELIFGIGTTITDTFSKIFEGLKNIFTGENKDFSGFTAIGIGAILYEVKSVLELLNGLADEQKGKKSVEKVKEVFDKVADIGSVSIESDKFTNLIKIAGAMWLFADSMRKIGDLDAIDFAQGMSAITIALGELGVFMKFMTFEGFGGFTKIMGHGGSPVDVKLSNTISDMGLFLLELSGALNLVAMAAQRFAKFNSDELKKGLIAITIVMGELFAFLRFSDTTSGGDNNPEKAINALNTLIEGGVLLALAEALNIMGDAATKFSKIGGAGDWEGLGKAGAAITVLLGELIGFTYAMPSKKHVAEVGVCLYLLAKSMIEFAEAAEMFGNMDWESLGKAGAAMTVIIGLVTAMVKLTQSTQSGVFGGKDNRILGIFNQKDSASMIELGAGLVVMAYAMKIFADAAKKFAAISWETLGKAGISISLLLGHLVVFSKFTEGNNLLKLTASLMIFAVSMEVLVHVFKGFESVGFDGVINSLFAMAGVLVTLFAAAKATESMASGMRSLSVTLLLFGAALAAIGIGMTLLSVGVGQATSILPDIINMIKEIILGVIDLITESASKIVEALMTLVVATLRSLEEHVPEIVDSLLGILVNILNTLATRIPEISSAIFKVVSGITEAFKAELGEMDPGAFIAAIAGITVFLVALAACATLAQNSLVGVIAIMAVLAEVTLMFLLLGQMDAEKTLAIAQGLSETLIALSITVGVLTLIGAGAAAAAYGVAAMAIVIAGIIAILAALGGLKQIPGFEWLIGEGMTILNMVGKAIGEFIGNLVGGIAVGITSNMPEIADNLSQFAIRLTPFLATMRLIDEKVVDSALSLVGVILALTAAELLDSLTSWFTGGTDINKFGEELEKFGPHIMAFSKSVAGINGKDVESAANAGKALAEMASALPNSGGVAGWFMGENDMKEFGKQLPKFGTAIMDFSATVKGLDSGVVENAAAAGKAMAEMASTLPNSGGVVGFFAGENDMDVFGDQLVSFGESIVKYSQTVKDLDGEVITKSAEACEAMVKMAQDLPNSGGAVSFFTGDNKLDDFGVQLISFAESMVEYSKKIKDIDQLSVAATNAMTAILIKLAQDLPNTGGVTGWFTGGTDFKKFGEQLQSFGDAMAFFNDSIAGKDFSGIDGFIDTVKKLIDLANYLGNVDTKLLSAFGKDCKSFVEKFGFAGKNYVTKFTEQFTNASEQVTSAINTFISYFITGLDLKMPEMFKAGIRAVEWYIRGLKSKKQATKDATKEIGNKALEGFEGLPASFYQVGVNCIMGLVNGLYDKDSISALAARLSKIADVMMEIIQGKLDERSPSKKFMQIGEYAIEGLVIGVGNKTKAVEDTMNDMGDTVVDNMQSVIDKVRESIDSNMNLSPTITPVLDLSDVTSNAGYINDLFNRSVAIGNVRAASIVRPNSINEMNLQNAQVNGVNGNTTFIQNNYSPKALTRSEIYRQTKNQFAQYREAMR